MSAEHERIDPPSPTLQSILDEARSEGPQIDWAKLEARLFDESGDVRAELLAERERTSVAGARGVRLAIAASAFAAAAAIVFALWSPRAKAPPTVTPGPANVASWTPLVDGQAKKVDVGAKLETAASDAWLRASGRIAIRVEPGSAIQVLDDGKRIRLSLTRGAVAADVVPVPGGEPFAVDVLGRRVAVHGTHLRVAVVGASCASCTDGRLEVAVSEGVAVIGTQEGDRTNGTEIPAGSIGTFSPASGSVAIDPARARDLVEGSLAGKVVPSLEPTLLGVTPKESSPSLAPPVSTKPATTVAPTKPSSSASPPPSKPGLSSDALEGPLAKALAAIQVCAPRKGPGVTSSFETTVTFEIEPTGRIAEFKGDLDPVMRDCFRKELANVTFPQAEGATTVTRKVVLDAQ